MIEGNVIIIGGPALQAKILRIQQGFADFRIPFKMTEIYLEGRFAETFEKGGEPKWKELSPMTKMLRRGNSAKPLNDTGRLKRVMSAKGRVSGASRRIYKKQMMYGVTSNYKVAHYMEKGATVKNGWGRGILIEIPARPFVHFVSRDLVAIEKIFNKYIDGLIV